MDAHPAFNPDYLPEILALLPLLESGQPLYKMLDAFSFDPYDYGPELCRWMTVVERSQFMIRFDWPQWLEEAKALDLDPALVTQADLLTLRKLVTVYLRTERFTSGTLAEIVDSGQLQRILQRVAALT